MIILDGDTTLLEEAYVKRAMIASAATYTVGPLRDLIHLVTESGVSEELLQPYRALGITVVME